MSALLSFIVSTTSFGLSLLEASRQRPNHSTGAHKLTIPFTLRLNWSNRCTVRGTIIVELCTPRGLFCKASLPQIPMPEKLPRRLICKGETARSPYVSPILAVFQLFQTMTRWPVREVWQSDSNCPAVQAPIWQLIVSTVFPFPTRMTYAS
jgi:hypothetical protein